VTERFCGWYAIEHRRVMAACAAYCGDVELAREATDEAFARAVTHWARVEHMEAPGAWVQTVALNCLRRSLRRRRIELMLTRRQEPTEVEAPMVHPELWAAVRRLPQRQRMAVVLRYVSDLSEQQIAETLGVRRGTVASSLAVARRQLAVTLENPNILEAEHG
jgi:RNA polymerase sigma factor (sigma-70 family)